MVYDPDAIAVEEIAPTFTSQFERRIRLGAGNFQTLFGHPEYLNPLQGGSCLRLLVAQSAALAHTLLAHRRVCLQCWFGSECKLSEPLPRSVHLLWNGSLGILDTQKEQISGLFPTPSIFLLNECSIHSRFDSIP